MIHQTSREIYEDWRTLIEWRRPQPPDSEQIQEEQMVEQTNGRRKLFRRHRRGTASDFDTEC